ncbi:hypothetical protein DTO006G1_8400 [Penicillium roqueforti]|nr:hypothetical protein CBS147337_5616 [Penicillium roqueforti]KAI2703561.1 hypothetical protein CBS147332_7547 [Penicillium roqueforti]KAI2723006.1 hypothetical protein CBS147354_5492 [Penicillium roqueforti]KAI2755172.1 hypothetical protein DTO006G1_8400 [Penicillium roqueforti]KAI3102926.1 hypothetical protein CBS147331_7574 [Penicillium roqueforti]
MVLMSHAVQRSIEDITMLTAYQLLACACYGPIGSALAHKYGKRPQFIFATIMGFIGTLVCCTTSDNYNVILAGRIIQGFSSAVFGGLTVAVMGDMCFVHQRSLRTVARSPNVVSPEEPTQAEDKEMADLPKVSAVGCNSHSTLSLSLSTLIKAAADQIGKLHTPGRIRKKGIADPNHKRPIRIRQ